MSERRTEVKTHLVTYACDSCGKGEMRSTGEVLPAYPPQYQHQCTSCDKRMVFHDAYPRIEAHQIPPATESAPPGLPSSAPTAIQIDTTTVHPAQD